MSRSSSGKKNGGIAVTRKERESSEAEIKSDGKGGRAARGSSAGGAQRWRELRCCGGLPCTKEWRGRRESSTEAQVEELGHSIAALD